MIKSAEALLSMRVKKDRRKEKRDARGEREEQRRSMRIMMERRARRRNPEKMADVGPIQGKERKGKERKGKERKGKERKGHFSSLPFQSSIHSFTLTEATDSL